jgi:lysophospholipase L1-like esterase
LKRSIVPLGVAIAILIGRGAASADVPPFELKDGDRVVLIGGTMIEREQESGYLETRLTRRYPDRNITFRNLGWSGDTVEGISQAGFGSVEDGFKHLVSHVLALKPTVIILGYGANESFEGKAGLPRFLKGLDRLLKAIEPTKARLVFLSPTRQENLGPPLPDPAAHNADLALYRDALKVEAERLGARFVDLFAMIPDGATANPRLPLTSNGLHHTPYGYFRLAAAIDEGLFPGPKPPSNGEPPDHPIAFAQIAIELGQIPGGYRLRNYRFKLLPASPPPDGGPNLPLDGYRFTLSDQEPGRYVLWVDGRPVATADVDGWREGVVIRQGPEFDQVETLRQAIIAKNQLYFYRWRPQNETYLFGFRKHEQGQNAREIPQFDPLVAAKEAEIARLRVPVPHVYELIREGEVVK